MATAALHSQPLSPELLEILQHSTIKVNSKGVMDIIAPTNAEANIIKAALTSKGTCDLVIYDKKVHVNIGKTHLGQLFLANDLHVIGNLQALGLDGVPKTKSVH